MLHIKESAQRGEQDTWIGPAPDITVAPPGIVTQQVIERGKRVLATSGDYEHALVIRRGSGSVVEDVDGNRFLDFSAGWAVCATGHCHPKVVEAVQEQAGRLLHAGGEFAAESRVRLAERLAAVAPGKSAKRVLFTNSGAESVDAAFKLARFQTGRKWVIAFQGAYHGRTMGALSLTFSSRQPKTGFEPLVPMVAHVPYGDLEALKRVTFRDLTAPEDIAAIFVEPVLGEGGYVVPPKSFLTGLRSLCDRHGILLVFDEIQTGFGRTGKMFACQHFGVVPDVLICAKGVASGLPLGAVVARERLLQDANGTLGSTFGGSPVSCAAALATLDVLESGLVANSARLGRLLQDRLRETEQRRKCIAKLRGLGLMVAVDLVNRKTGRPDPRRRNAALQEALQRGLILLPCGESGIRFCPPLCINETQLNVGLDVFDEVIATVLAL